MKHQFRNRTFLFEAISCILSATCLRALSDCISLLCIKIKTILKKIIKIQAK